MKNGLTEIVFILDKSGSMAALETDTIGGFNAMLEKQKKEEGEANITTVLFNHDVKFLHERIPINDVAPLTENEYRVGGMTALLDAIGISLQKMSNFQKNAGEEEKADRVLFVITTDGMENSSREFSTKKIKEMIEHYRTRLGWEFIFLGANIDAISTAESFGIDKDFAVDYRADKIGTMLNFEVLTEVVANYRQGKELDKNWKKKIEYDYKHRG